MDSIEGKKVDKEIEYQGVKLNSDEFRALVLNLKNNPLSKDAFIESIKTTPSFKDKPLEIKTDLFFKLTKVARLSLDYESYCKVVGTFFEWDPQYKREYRSARMFKNLILEKAAGESFPIRSPADLKDMIEKFKNASGSASISYLDILDEASLDYGHQRIRKEEYIKVIYYIIKCVGADFEKEVCKRAANTFEKVGDTEKALEYRRIMKRW